MHLNADVSSALQQFEAIKKAVNESDDPKLQMGAEEDLQLIFNVLQDPVFRSIVQIQDSLSELNSQITQHPSILPNDFDITLSGDLVVSVPPPNIEIYDPDYPDEQRVPSAQISPRSPISPAGAVVNSSYHNSANHGMVSTNSLSLDKEQSLAGIDNSALDSLSHHQTRGLVEMVVTRTASHDDERPQSAIGSSTGDVGSKNLSSNAAAVDLMSTEWTQVQAIELVNDGTGLGFGIIGARTAGVIVKTILAGGVADRDGRLLSGDHILQIGDVNLHDMGSEQVASVLRQSGTHVRLVVARPIDPIRSAQDVDGSAIVPSRLMNDPVELERYLTAAGYPEIFGVTSTPSTPTPTAANRFSFQGGEIKREDSSSNDIDLPETEKFTVELRKDHNGLGITIAGYVCEKEELSGIFVKSISQGSAADVSGQIQVNDRIIEVDGHSLQGFSNHQAVDVLKQSGAIVTLCLERYLRGPKYEQLQQAIAANELKPSTPSTPPTHSMTSLVTPSYTTSKSQVILTQPTSHDPLRRSSVTKSPIIGDDIYNNADHIHQAIPVAAVAGVANSSLNSSFRKLTQARDSIENKIPKTNDQIDDTIESNVDDDDMGQHFPSHQQHIHHASNVVTLTQLQAARKISLVETANVPVISRHKYYVEPELTPEIEMTIKKKWRSAIGNDVQIIVAQIRKFAAQSGLGISLEGTVDVEGGREVRPHHYIRSILPEGPVGLNGLLRSGDELLEVNGQRLLGMNHLEVVSILKELQQDVRMVCGRGPVEMVPFNEETMRNALGYGFGGSQNLENLLPVSDRLVKAKSDGSLATTGVPNEDGFMKMKSRSLEPLTGLAMWSSEPQIIELIKGERGLGFSILDYQDPLDPNDTLIVIRSLVPGGVAQLDGRLIPGDRLLFVNDINLENASLDQAVQALKGAPKGLVRIGVAKPLPMADTSLNFEKQQNDANNMMGFGGNNKPDVIKNWQGK